MVRIFIAIFFISCQHNSKSLIDLARMDVNIDDSDIKSITVDSSNAIILSEKEAKEVMDFGMFIDSIEYIPLETGGDILIGRISKVIMHNDRFYLLDKSIAKSIFIFNKKGKHLNTISALGRGPNEYIAPKNITIDKFNNELILVDTNDFSLHYYDLDGNFKRKEKCGVRFLDCVKITREDLLMYTGTYWNIQDPELYRYRIFIGNPSGQLKWRGFFKDEFYNKLIMTGSQHIHECGENILFAAPLTNTIHQINPDGTAILRYKFVFRNGSPELYKNLDTNNTNIATELKRNNMDYYIGNFLAETNDHLIIMIKETDFIRHFIYDKNTSKYFVANFALFGKTIGTMEPLFTDGNSVYSVVEPSHIYMIKNVIKEGIQIPPEGWQLPKVLENVKEEDNPVIVRYTLRTK